MYTLIDLKIDGQIYDCIDRWIKDGWTDRQTDGLQIYGWIDIQIDGKQMNGCIDRQIDAKIYRKMDKID